MTRPMIALVSLYLVPLLLLPFITHATPADLPVIKLDAVGQLGFAGDYAGISPFRDTRQFESVPDPSFSSVVLQNNNTFELIASTTSGGSILAACVHNATASVYLGGSFTMLNDTTANNIVRYDVASDSLQPLGQGLDGTVQALMCDNDTVYVGGDFAAPVGTPNATLPTYGSGHVAFWFPGNNSWGAAPWSGFNGPVYTITRNAARSTLLFGGRFDATGDGVYYNANSSQAVNLASPATTVTGGNSALTGNFSNPSNIICRSNETQGEPWLLQDGMPGYWDASFGYSVEPTMFRIGNANYEGRGTQSFSIIALGSNEYFELSYVDPATHETVTCTTDCALSNDTTVGYQDFTVVSPQPATGIRIQIDSWYGQGGGLGSVEIFQSDIAVHPQAGAADSSNSCSSSTPSSSSTTTTGDWQSQFVYGIYQDFLTASIPVSELSTSNASVTYAPNIPVQGQYAVYATTPGCVGSSSCDQRTQVDLTLQFTPGMTTTVTVDQANYDDKTTMIYNGFIAASTGAFQPTITLKPAVNATASGGSTVTLVADTFQFVRNGTNATLVSILEYSPQNYTQRVTPAWHPLTEQLMLGSTVRSIDATAGNTLYIGGQFSSVNGTYRSVVSYDYTSGRMVPLNDVGVNGSVYSVATAGSSLFVGGLFSGTAAAGAGGAQLNNLARYDLAARRWSAMGMGVDGPVTNILPDNATVTISGNFTHVLGQGGSDLRVGNAVWNDSEQQWTERTSLIVGTITGNETLNTTASVLTGRILGAQTYRADDASLLDTSNHWTPYLLDTHDPAGVVHTGVFWHNVTADGQNKTVVIVGGRFNRTNGIRNLALYQDGSWQGIGQLDGEVLSLVQLKDRLYIGGQFSGTLGDGSRVSSFAIYDLAARKAINVGSAYAANGSPGAVNAVRMQPDGKTIYVGGNFSTVGSMRCPSICKLDVENTQWNTVALGISGNVYDLAVTNDQVIAVGDLTVDQSPTTVATMQIQGNSWSAMSQHDTSSFGTARAVLSGPNKEAIVAGRNATGSFLGTWDGQQFSDIDAHLGPSSDIRQLVFMPIASSPSDSRYPADSEYMLLASGHLDLGIIGNASTALYDGSQWFPLALSTKIDGTPGQLQEVFRETTCCTAIDVIHHLPVPAVILISIAVSLGLIFVLVGTGLLALFAKRKYSEPDAPEPMPPYLPGQNNRPSSLVAMLDSAQAKTLGAGAAAAIAGAAAAGSAAAGPSNEKHQQQEPQHEPTTEGVAPTSAFATLMATAAPANSSVAPSDESPQLYYAKYPFEAKEYGELGFDANEPIVVTDASDNVWWMGYKDDGTGKPVSGLFPSNYVSESKS